MIEFTDQTVSNIIRMDTFFVPVYTLFKTLHDNISFLFRGQVFTIFAANLRMKLAVIQFIKLIHRL